MFKKLIKLIYIDFIIIFKIILKQNTNFFLIPTLLDYKILQNEKQEYFFIFKNEVNLIILNIKNLILIDESTNCILLKSNVENFWKKYIISNTDYLVSLAFKSLNLIQQIKLVFKGKSYKIRKASTHKYCVELDFHKSHKSLYIFKNIFFKKLRKSKLLLLSYNYFFIQKIASNIVNIRNFNSYTKRGIRAKSQLIPKRLSKKSLKKK